MTTPKIVSDWLRRVEQSRSPSTYALYRSVLEQICTRFGSPSSWSGTTISDYLAWCAKRGNCAASRNTKLQVIRCFLREASLDVPCSASVAFTREPPQAASEEQLEAVLGRIGVGYRLAVLLMADAGLREGEVRAMRWADVEDGAITVHGKGNKVRFVPVVTERLRRALEEARPSNGQAQFVVPGRKGKLSREHLTRLIAQAASEAGQPHLTSHSLRHRFASHAMRRGVPLKAIQQALGHSNIATTDRYLRSLDSDALALKEMFASFDEV